MSVVAVQTGASFGIWRMPQRAQSIIMNNYARIKEMEIEGLVPEGVFYQYFPMLQRSLQVRRVEQIIFTSVYQLPANPAAVEVFICNFKDRTLHFALEGFSGIGEEFIRNTLQELEVFRKTARLSDANTVYEIATCETKVING
jgi:sporadic carbohydrate cluster protein (TIGR04323 family)